MFPLLTSILNSVFAPGIFWIMTVAVFLILGKMNFQEKPEYSPCTCHYEKRDVVNENKALYQWKTCDYCLQKYIDHLDGAE